MRLQTANTGMVGRVGFRRHFARRAGPHVYLWIPRFFLILARFPFRNCGAMVQRLARGPFKAEIRVRFPLALPKIRNLESLIATQWGFAHCRAGARHAVRPYGIVAALTCLI